MPSPSYSEKFHQFLQWEDKLVNDKLSVNSCKQPGIKKEWVVLKRKRITNTVLDASVICLGTSNIGSTVNTEDSHSILDTYTGYGGNFLDTAEVYANWLPIEPNSSERFLGKWMKERGNRNDMLVATKGGHPLLTRMDVSRLSPEEIRIDLEGSLRRLQTDYIDLYYLHRDDLTLPVESIIESLETHVRKGQIRYYACSNWTLPRLEEARQYAAKQGYKGFAAVSNLWNLAEVNPGAVSDPTMVITDRELISWHKRTGIPLIPYSSQANGFFSGKYRREQETDSVSASKNVIRMYANDTSFARLERVEQTAGEYGATSNQIALAWLLSQPFPVFPVVGCKTKQHLTDSLGAADIELAPDTVSYIEG
ncbi:MAG: aldo/keto reductase [Paenibacillus sp.]|jgi:aryl-alcohol dehydrogenase-like predicted oxidoreductase|nr:aldo/keto reductase [Paenibacillus sp.]